METSISDVNHVLLHAQDDRWVLGPIETSANHVVFHAQINRRSLGPIETRNSDPKDAVLHAKTTDEGWDP